MSKKPTQNRPLPQPGERWCSCDGATFTIIGVTNPSPIEWVGPYRFALHAQNKEILAIWDFGTPDQIRAALYTPLGLQPILEPLVLYSNGRWWALPVETFMEVLGHTTQYHRFELVHANP